MGIKNSPDIFQKIIGDLTIDLPYVNAYIDDILITSNGSFQDHLDKLNEVLKRLSQAGFRMNVRKSNFAVDKIEYLGYWLTRDGIMPQPKKVEAVKRLAVPKTKRQLRHFLGIVNYYRDMWKRRSHILAPLTELASKTKPFKWGDAQDKAFRHIKKVICRETLLSYPDFNEPFEIYTDASNYQLGAVIMQKGKPLAFYSRKLNSAQKRYTTGEQELLSIVETLKEFRNILLGQQIIVHTDHKNILYEKLSSDRIIRWRLLLEEYGPEYKHVKGQNNVVADALSRMDMDAYKFDEDAPPTINYLATAYLAENEQQEHQFPMLPATIGEEQKKDPKLQKLLKDKPNDFSTKIVEDTKLTTMNGKIYIPENLQLRTVAWYHEYLSHPGQVRTEQTLRQHFIWPGLRTDVEKFCKTCKKCQLTKKRQQKYGKLPVKDTEAKPWNEVHVDLIGPWTVTANGQKHQLNALTIIDPANYWFEIEAIKEKTPDAIQDAFDSVWLCRYPRPKIVRCDNGTEFKAIFKRLCDNFGLDLKPTTAYNPTANGIVERVHQTLGNMLRTHELEDKELDPHEPFKMYLSSVAWAIRSTYHTTLDATPGQVVFGRDMILPIQHKADWALIRQRKERAIERNNARENKTRTAHTFRVGEKVLLTKPGRILPKLRTPTEGPYEIQAVYANGTVKIDKGTVTEKVSLRRILPYHERTN